MIITRLLPEWLIWTDWRFPFVHVRRGQPVAPREWPASGEKPLPPMTAGRDTSHDDA